MGPRVESLLLPALRPGGAWTAREVITGTLVLPMIYSLLIPFVLLDVWIQSYQAMCFRLLDLRRVRRRDYFVVDRHLLPYLNPIQKANCAYCGYVNGLVAFTREVAGRTEQYWCPIKHKGRSRIQHRRQRRFAPYDDAASFARLLPQLRQELAAPRRRRAVKGRGQSAPASSSERTPR